MAVSVRLVVLIVDGVFFGQHALMQDARNENAASSLWCKQLILGTASGVLGFVGSPRI
jgi:hypothetical protein